MDQTDKKSPNLRRTISIGTDINYLNVNISHIDGHLRTNVAHHLHTEPYSLPYVFGHPRYHYKTLLRAALIHAVQCCSTVFTFANEVHDLQLSFQYNNFSNELIRETIDLFLQEFATPQLKIYLDETYYDQELYDHLRKNVCISYDKDKQSSKYGFPTNKREKHQNQVNNAIGSNNILNKEKRQKLC